MTEHDPEAGDDLTVIDRWDGGLGWFAHPEESMRRASHAIAVDDEVWLLDPVDAPGLDDLIADLGEVTGVAVLLDRHTRDAGEIAARHDVPVSLPDFFDGVAADLSVPVTRFAHELGETGYGVHTVVDSRFWQEVALYGAADGTLVVPEALGTAAFFRAPGERLGVHPGLRPWPPRGLARFGPERILVGHGSGIHDGAAEALADALAGARRRAPRAYLRMLRQVLPW